MMTVKMGAELFTVSAKETATFFRLTKPRTTVMNLAEGAGGGGGSILKMNAKKLINPRKTASFFAGGQQTRIPHESDKEHYHDEILRVLAPGFVFVQAARHKHLQAANDGGGEHLNST